MLGTCVLVGLLAGGGTGTLQLNVTPKTATVKVDGKTVKGFKSGRGFAVQAGTRTVVATAPGFKPLTRKLAVKPGQTTIVNLRLSRSSKRGTAAPSKRPSKKRPSARPAEPRGKPSLRPSKRPDTKKPAARPSKRPLKPAAKAPPTPKKRPATKRPPTKRPAAKPPVKKRPSRRPAAKPAAPAPAARPRPATGGSRDTGSVSTKPWAVLSFVVGGLAVTGGVIAGLSANDAADDFNASFDRNEKLRLKDDSENLALLSNVLYGVGATGMVLGAVLWAMDPGPGARAEVGPLPGGGAYVGVGGTW